MAKRVGFNDKQRKRAAGRDDTNTETPAPRGDPSWARNLRFGPHRVKVLRPGQTPAVIWVVIGFLCFWLVGWTFAIFFTIAALLGGKPGTDDVSLFFYLWLGFATIGWGLAVWILSKMIRGVRAAGRKPVQGRPD